MKLLPTFITDKYISSTCKKWLISRWKFFISIISVSFHVYLNVVTSPLSRFSFLPPSLFFVRGWKVCWENTGLVSAAGILEQDVGWMHVSMPDNCLQAVQDLAFLR